MSDKARTERILDAIEAKAHGKVDRERVGAFVYANLAVLEKIDFLHIFIGFTDERDALSDWLPTIKETP